ncbi:MAG: S-DNA-T family DNA segregation ATPase FtsK/SpoIIIE [Limisphaerales bacterium]|jgi:S-DNA-T family DNA segregation ATPase FtsK/SpoIIIE
MSTLEKPKKEIRKVSAKTKLSSTKAAKNAAKPAGKAANGKSASKKSGSGHSASGGSRKKTTGKVSKLKFWNDSRYRKVAGLFFILLAVFMLVAFVSYCFQYTEDHDKVHGRGLDVLWDGSVEVSNALGRLGAWIANELIWLRFGIPAFLLVLCTGATGFNLLHDKQYVKLSRLYFFSALAMLWSTTALAFLAGSGAEILGGGIGRYISGWLEGAVGALGTGIFLVFVLSVWAAIFLNASFGLNLPFGLSFSGINGKSNSEDTEDQTENDTEKAESLAPTYHSAGDIIKDNEVELDPKVETEHIETKPGHTKLELESITVEEVITPALSKEPAEIVEDPSTNSSIDQDGFEEVKPTSKNTGSVRTSAAEEEEALELDIADTPDEAIVAKRGSLESHYDPTLELAHYQYPKLELLEDYGSSNAKINTEELERNKDQIIETLNNYNITISKIKATIGPTVTLYEIVPAKGVRISKIKNLEDDIALSLAALGIRIIAPIPGRGTIGIEVPNVDKSTVGMKTQLGSEKFTSSDMDLPICLGKTISSENYVADLARMPHLLLAGATGQGKSVGINAILISLLYKKHPSELKLILIDPKKVELSLFQRIERHFLAKLPGEEEAIITDIKKVIHVLNALCIEMDQRYDLLKSAQTRNIKEYNKKFLSRKLNPENGHKFLPYIVLVIDEFADLIMTAGKEVEMPIARLAQLARAIGIHLVIATQRPSVNIITGLIKANFPARIAFKVTAKVDSRTILDTSGADQLIGRGDMLLSIGSDIVRLQCPFVDTPEVERVADFIGEQQAPAEQYLLPEYIDEKDSSSSSFDATDRDVLFEDAAKLIIGHQQGSTSLIQRRMKLGYNRAGRLMDQLEQAGIVGPSQGSKAREVLYHTEAELEQFLNL